MSDLKTGVLVIISGFSGAGKGTVVKKLLETYPDIYRLSISATTRQPRVGEEHGKHYFFISKDEFENMIEKGELLEHARYVENYYGTPKNYVQQQLEAGHDVILEIEQQGALKVKEAMPEAVLVFLTAPSIPELEKRLRDRGTESEEVILSRLAQAAVEAEKIHQYDYIVENVEVSDCAEKIHGLLTATHAKTCYNMKKIQELRNQLESYRKGE